VKHKNAPAELARMLSPFTAGDYTRTEFNELFATQLNGGRAPGEHIGPEKRLQVPPPPPGYNQPWL
jgi:hypothetical protein|tara:strand:+ start:1346 stop:1543 length:198 start_codon:yes stop_codon:yes gene_type:complete